MERMRTRRGERKEKKDAGENSAFVFVFLEILVFYVQFGSVALLWRLHKLDAILVHFVHTCFTIRVIFGQNERKVCSSEQGPKVNIEISSAAISTGKRFIEMRTKFCSMHLGTFVSSAKWISTTLFFSTSSVFLLGRASSEPLLTNINFIATDYTKWDQFTSYKFICGVYTKRSRQKTNEFSDIILLRIIDQEETKQIKRFIIMSKEKNGIHLYGLWNMCIGDEAEKFRWGGRGKRAQGKRTKIIELKRGSREFYLAKEKTKKI